MSTKLNETQFAAIRLLSTGSRAVDVALALKTTKETISRWRQVPAFMAALNAELIILHEDSRAAMRELQGAAVVVVKEILADTGAPARTRLSAATYVLGITGLSMDPLEAVGPWDAESVANFARWKRMNLESQMVADIR